MAARALRFCASRRSRLLLLSAGPACAAVAAGLLASAVPAAAPGPALCGSLVGQPPHITKVMWIFMENRSYGTSPTEIPGDPSASYIDHTLIADCGSTSAYDGVTHPSYPN